MQVARCNIYERKAGEQNTWNIVFEITKMKTNSLNYQMLEVYVWLLKLFHKECISSCINIFSSPRYNNSTMVYIIFQQNAYQQDSNHLKSKMVVCFLIKPTIYSTRELNRHTKCYIPSMIMSIKNNNTFSKSKLYENKLLSKRFFRMWSTSSNKTYHVSLKSNRDGIQQKNAENMMDWACEWWGSFNENGNKSTHILRIRNQQLKVFAIQWVRKSLEKWLSQNIRVLCKWMGKQRVDEIVTNKHC